MKKTVAKEIFGNKSVFLHEFLSEIFGINFQAKLRDLYVFRTENKYPTGFFI